MHCEDTLFLSLFGWYYVVLRTGCKSAHLRPFTNSSHEKPQSDIEAKIFLSHS